MKLYLLKAFLFREYDQLPYRSDGRGGNVFHGVGSHILWSDLRNRFYSFAFEVATEGQADTAELKEARLLISIGDSEEVIHSNDLRFKSICKRTTKNPLYNSYLWFQHAEIDIQEPTMVTIRVEMRFSDSEKWLQVEGETRLLVDLHPGEPPPYYGKFHWYLRRMFGKRH